MKVMLNAEEIAHIKDLLLKNPNKRIDHLEVDELEVTIHFNRGNPRILPKKKQGDSNRPQRKM